MLDLPKLALPQEIKLSILGSLDRLPKTQSQLFVKLRFMARNAYHGHEDAKVRLCPVQSPCLSVLRTYYQYP